MNVNEETYKIYFLLKLILHVKKQEKFKTSMTSISSLFSCAKLEAYYIRVHA